MKKLVEVHPRNNKQNESESESEGTVHNLALSSEKIEPERDSNQLAQLQKLTRILVRICKDRLDRY